MVLEWFAGARDESIDELVRRKRYGKAVKLLRAELEKRKGDRRLRLRLGEILVLAGQREEGLRILSRTADDLALQGQVAQAIAVLKKIEAIDPGREDVEDKMAYLVERRARPGWDPWSGKGKAARATEDSPEGAGDGAGALEIGFEPSERLEEAPAAAPPSTGDAPPIDVADDAPLSEDAMRNEILALIEDTLRPADASAPAATPSTAAAAETPAPATAQAPAAPADASLIDTPLFRNFSRDELAALIRGLRLLAFQPGEVVVSEGERGASLFLLVSGSVRAYVRNAGHHQVQVRELKEGDFFGEISVLTGQPRSATVVAAARCELLELDKPTLDRIAGAHPHVREVLQEFYDQRADNTLETMIRSMGLT